MTYSDMKQEAMREHGFSPRKAMEFVMESRYHGHSFSRAEELAEESSDRYYRSRYYEVAEEVAERLDEVKGYSRGQVSSVMTVLDCDIEMAKKVCNLIDMTGDLDWSEATWEEIYESANNARVTL